MTAFAPTRDRSIAERVRARRASRALSVLTAAATVVATWAIVELGFGFDLRVPAFDPSMEPADVGVVVVLAATVTATLAGWGWLAVLERWTGRSPTLWTASAVVAAGVSLGGPLSGTGISAANRLVLMAFHVLVAVVYIPLMRRTTADSGDER